MSTTATRTVLAFCLSRHGGDSLIIAHAYGLDQRLVVWSTMLVLAVALVPDVV